MSLLEKILYLKILKNRKPFELSNPQCISDFSSCFDQIVKEWNAFQKSNLEFVPQIDDISIEQEQLNKDKKWKAIIIYGYEYYLPIGLEFFPKTIQLIKKWESEITLVFFSILEPGKHIPAHVGNNHCVIRTQIGIDIQEPEKTGLKVLDTTVKIKNSEVVSFDDTFEHEAWNKSDSPRIVLIIDSRKKISFFYDILIKIWLKKMKKSDYVQNALFKLRNQSV